MIGGRRFQRLRFPSRPWKDLRTKIPEVAAITYLVPGRMTVTVGDRQFLETVTVVDPDFLQVIKLPLSSGDPAHVLAHPGSVVLSQTMARKVFRRFGSGWETHYGVGAIENRLPLSRERPCLFA